MTKVALLCAVLCAGLLLVFFLNHSLSDASLTTIKVNSSELTTATFSEEVLLYNDDLFTGTAVSYYPSGSLKAAIAYKQGKKKGVAQHWYQNGQLRSLQHFVKNNLEGISYNWWPSGVQSAQSNFKNNVKHGTQTKWYINGQCASIQSFKLGKEQGLQQSWTYEGALLSNYQVINDRYFGLKKSSICYQLKNEIIKN